MTAAAVSLLGGLIFAMVYDLFKALRLSFKNAALTVISDIIICVFGFGILFLLAMWIGGGEARIYMTLLAALAAAIYFFSLSPFFL